MRKRMTHGAAALCSLLLSALVTRTACAQPPAAAGGEQPGRGPAPGPFGMMGGPPGGGNPIMGLIQLLSGVSESGVAIAVAGEFVYVVKGSTLYQFTVKDLKEVNKVVLAPPQGPGMMGGFFPGGPPPPPDGRQPPQGNQPPPPPGGDQRR